MRRKNYEETADLTCYTCKRGRKWEAICIDLDVSVFGSSPFEVRTSLKGAVELHLEGIGDLPPAEREAVLAHRTPAIVLVGLQFRRASRFTIPFPCTTTV